MENKIHINPPPIDRKCQKCGKHTSELKPFGGPGEPLVGDFTGALLLKNYRSMYQGEPIEEYEKILDEYVYDSNNQTDNMKELEDKYGSELLNDVFTYEQLCGTIGASWECRDCFIC
jgi:hypothetical protein